MEISSGYVGQCQKTLLHNSEQMFILSRGGMSRGEGTMNWLKGNVSLKKEMWSYSLYKVVMHYVRMTKQQDDESILVIKDLIVSGRHWSKFVHEKWEVDNKKTWLYDSYMENSDLQIRQCIERKLNGTFHKIQKKGNKDATIHDVVVPESTNSYPSS